MLHQHRPPRRVPELFPPPRIVPWAGTPQRPHALVTLATGEKGAALLELSGPILRSYAERHGLDFHVIAGEPGRFPLARKWEVAGFIQAYERVLWLDADLILAPDAPNLLDLVPTGHFAAFDDWPDIISAETGRQWILSECRELAQSQGWPLTVPPETWNTGVYVADRSHLEAFTPPARPYPRRHCVEQNHVSMRLAALDLPRVRLPREWNYQWWVRREAMTEPLDGVQVYHFAGLFSDYPHRLRQMRTLRDALYPSLA